MASKNHIELVLYLRVTTPRSMLLDANEAAYEEDPDWPYQIESGAPEGESWLSLTLLSEDYDAFPAVWLGDVNFPDEALKATTRVNAAGFSVLETRLGLVCWYDASDRPFPR